MKTVKEWFKELPDGIRELALDNLKNNDAAVSLRQALAGSFSWIDSREGLSFWGLVYDAADGLAEYPKIPQNSKQTDPAIESLGGYKDKLEIYQPDPIVESVIKSFRERSAGGIEKYGTTLADNPAKLIEWVNHAQEEVMDLCLYLERIKQELSANKPINPNIDQ